MTGMVRLCSLLLGMTVYAGGGCTIDDTVIAGGQRRAILPVRVGVGMTGVTVTQMLGVDGSKCGQERTGIIMTGSTRGVNSRGIGQIDD